VVRPKNWERYSLTAARRLHYNKLAIVLANKLVRIAMLSHLKVFSVSAIVLQVGKFQNRIAS
jgi:hypothetical protein